MELLGNLAFGFDLVFTPTYMFYCILGVTVGMAVGVLPGIGPLATISLLLPLTFNIPPLAALVMLAGIYYGAMYGGSIASILLNLPGSVPSAVACLDGYPMARQGRAGPALLMSTIASFVGGTFSLILLAGFAPMLAGIALSFGSPEYFALISFALIVSAAISDKGAYRSLGMILIGILVSVVGMDINSGVQRFTFGSLLLVDGISLVVVALGLFGIAEACNRISDRLSGHAPLKETFKVTLRSLMPTLDDVRRSVGPIIRGTLIGSAFGALPGTGASLGAYLGYSVERRVSREPDRFGKGAIEGVTAPEAANNAAAQTAFIPTLTLGIPGDAIMAMMLGVLLIHGIVPGPEVMTRNPELFWGLVASMWVGNVLLLILNIPLIGLWVRFLLVPYRLLYPAIVIIASIGVYSLKVSSLDVLLLALFGVAGFLLVRLKCEIAPLLLGFILGPLMEEHFRRSLFLSRGDPMIFFERPVSAMFMSIVLVALGIIAVGGLRRSFGSSLERTQ